MKKNILKFAAMAACAVFAFAACDENGVKNDETEKTGPDAVCADNLVLYMPFEDINSPMESGVGVTFNKKVGDVSVVTGARGNAYLGDTNGYLAFTLADENFLTHSSSFTVSCWLRVPEGPDCAAIINVDGGDDGMGAFGLLIENGWYDLANKGDMTAVKGYIYNSTTTWMGQDITTQVEEFPRDKWFYYTWTYDETTSQFLIYANGVQVADAIKYSDDVQADGSQPLLGALTFAPGSNLYVGVWKQVAEGLDTDSWRTNYVGYIDELRFYNKALSETEVKSLYTEEVLVMNE